VELRREDELEVTEGPAERADVPLELIERRGRVQSRDTLLNDVWGYESVIDTRTVDTHIAELRRKLEPNPASPRHITTVWKTGYRFLP
jgi:two-component system phosphate regulon response regulator PhoB